MDNIQQLLDNVIRNDILGDFVECGVWRGGASLFARAYLHAHGVSDRKVSSVNILQAKAGSWLSHRMKYRLNTNSMFRCVK